MIELDALGKRFGNVDAVKSVTLNIEKGELVSLLGPSGCGKTTTLRMVAGFEAPTSGRLRIAGKDMTDVPVQNRGLSMVFQNYALFPHLTVAENVAFGLALRKLPKPEIAERVREGLQRVGLHNHDDRLPRQLSGGQQQRVALARALVVNPSVLLMDEPLSNLDLKLREQLRDEIRSIQRSLGITAIYVTHDQGEAMAMSDRIAVMNGGLVEQIGAPRDIYEHPATTFVAGFIGQCNIIDGRYDPASGEFRAAGGTLFHTARKPVTVAGHLRLAIRPESIRFEPSQGAAVDEPNTFSGVIRDIVYLGDFVQVSVSTTPDGGGTGDILNILHRVQRDQPMPSAGETVTFSVSASDCLVVVDRES